MRLWHNLRSAPLLPHRCEPRRTCLIVPAAHHEFNHLIAVERVEAAENVKRGESPVHGVEPQVRRQVVSEVRFALRTRFYFLTRLVRSMGRLTHLAELLDVGDVEVG